MLRPQKGMGGGGIEEGEGFWEEVPLGLRLGEQASTTHTRQKGPPDRGMDTWRNKGLSRKHLQFGLAEVHGVPEPPAGQEAGQARQRPGLAGHVEELGLFLEVMKWGSSNVIRFAVLQSNSGSRVEGG